MTGEILRSSSARDTVALHACCGPCLIEPLDALRSEGHEVIVVFANPNIQPLEEYVLRRDTLESYARTHGIRTVEIDVGPETWRDAAGDASRPERCRACYRVRLGLVAQWAARNGVDAVATTLSVSPYQDAEAIAEEGRAVAQEAGIGFIERDYRERYPVATRRSRAEGMYRQNYCGCLPSRAEAEAEREARRRTKEAQRRCPEG
ncbi:MAG: epoxyqueuosine reductase QueH [Coriobacteriia bacterium]|nr:epoxyqueuosine reductase QueH [Coriobacteriia bacterium]